MRKLIITAALGLGALGSGVAATGAFAQGTAGTSTTAAPASGTASTSGAQNRPDPGKRLEDALAPLVTDGTLTAAQKDKVVAALKAAGPIGGGGPGMGHGRPDGPIETTATLLGIEPQVLHTELAGKSLAQVTEAHGKTRQQLLDALTAAENKHIDQAVTDGRMTAAEATTKKAAVAARVAEQADKVHSADDHQGGPPPAAAPAVTPTTAS